MDSRAGEEPTRVGAILVLAGVLGFLIGTGLGARWHFTVEQAQILSGVVEYPWPTPQYIHHSSLWSLTNQVVAVPLWLGMDARTVTILVSGAVHALCFQGLALTALALAPTRPVVALAAPFCTLIVYPMTYTGFGDVYPVRLSIGNTHGQLGVFLAVLGFALLGVGWRRAGAVLLGLAPGAHGLIGAFAWIAAVVAALWSPRDRGSHLAVLPWFAVGAAVTIASLMVHLALSSDVPAMDAHAAAQVVERFVSLERYHHRPSRVDSPGFMLNLAITVVAIASLVRRDEPDEALSSEGAFLLRAVAAMGVLGTMFCAASWVGDQVPTWLARFMPARLASVNATAALALLMGLLARRSPGGDLGVLSLVAVGFLETLLPDLSVRALATVQLHLMVAAAIGLSCWPLTRRTPPQLVLAGALLVACAGLAVPPLAPAPTLWQLNWYSVRFHRLDLLLPVVLVAMVAARWSGGILARPKVADRIRGAVSLVLVYEVGWLILASLLFSWMGIAARVLDSTGPDTATAARSGTGILLLQDRTDDVQPRAQLTTGRPLIASDLRNWTTAIPYVPQAGPATEAYWRDLYGLSLEDVARMSWTEWEFGPALRQRVLWESWTAAQWCELSARYGFTQVVTHSGTTLALPVAASGVETTLYDVEGCPGR